MKKIHGGAKQATCSDPWAVCFEPVIALTGMEYTYMYVHIVSISCENADSL